MSDVCRLIEDAFKASPLLCQCAASDFACRLVKCTAGQIVLDEYRHTPCVGLLAKGQIDVYSLSPDGKEVLLNSITPGGCFGIINLMNDFDLGTTLRCALDAKIIYIPKADLRKVMQKDGDFVIRYANICNEKMQFLLRKIELLTIQSCRGKLVAYLLINKDSHQQIRLDCSREELAKRLDVSRAALFRELAALQSCGALRIDGNLIRIVNQDILKQQLAGHAC